MTFCNKNILDPQMLFDTHIPDGTDFSERMDYSGDLPIQLIEEIKSKEKIIWAIGSFKHFRHNYSKPLAISYHG